MTASLSPATMDFLTQATAYVRPFWIAPTSRRAPTDIWAAVVATRDVGASDVVEEEFLQLAREVGLFDDLGRHAEADLRHVIRWAMLDQNPFR